MRQVLAVARFQSTQPVYNLFERGIEGRDLPFCEREGIGVLAHSQLGKGLLTGSYRQHHRFPSDDERSNSPHFQGADFSRYLTAAGRLSEVARGKGLTLPQLAIAWLLRKPAVSCVLFGARSVAQVEENARAVGVSFSNQELAEVASEMWERPGSN